MKKFCLALFIASFAALAQAGTELPSGCGTFVICESKKDANDEPDGDQVCRNADNKKIIVIQAHWKKNQLDKDFFCANDDGVPKVKAYYKNGKLDGVYQEYDSSLKQWALVENYSNGKREGLSKSLLPNGKTIVKFYKNNHQHGYEIVLDQDGKLQSKRNCRINDTYAEDSACELLSIPGYEKLLGDSNEQNRKKKEAEDNRVVEEKYANGKIKERYKLVGGKKQGLYERYFPNGSLGEKYTLVDGIKDGLYEAYFESGILEMKTLYRKGEKIERSNYFKEGQIEELTYFKKDSPFRQIKYYQNGKISVETIEQEQPLAQGWIRLNVKRYHDNGQLSEKSSLLKTSFTEWGNQRQDGARELFSREGKLLEREFYDNGKRIGLWKSYDSQYDYETQYIDDVKLNHSIFEKKTHKQLKKTDYMPDGSTRLEVIDPSFKDQGE